MSISYTEVKDKETLRKAAFYGAKEYVIAKVESDTLKKIAASKKLGLSSCFLMKRYLEVADQIINFKVRPDDVWVTSFPKAGTTWVSNIVWQLKHNLDFSAEFIDARFNFFEAAIFCDDTDENKNDPDYQETKARADNLLDTLSKASSPRQFKSHLPAHFLPAGMWTVKPKLIYVHRNVKDVAVSMFYMFRKYKFIAYEGSIEDCFDSFLNNSVMYGPFHLHVQSYRQFSSLFDNVLILSYEKMLANPFKEIKRISEFLNYDYSDDQLNQLVKHVSFQNMHDSKSDLPVNDGFNFYRKGKANGYRDEMSAEYIQKFEEWERKHSAE